MMMNSFKKRLGLILILLTVINFGIKAQGIEFLHGSYEEALAKAKEANKPLFIDVFTSWCGPCKKLSKNIFPQKEVGDYFNEKFVCYKLQADKNKTNKELAKKLKVRAYPTLMWMNSEGNLLHVSTGYKEAKRLIAEASKVFDENKRVGTAITKWNNGDRSFEIVKKYFSYDGNATGEFDKYFNSLSYKEKIDAKLFGLISNISIDVEGKTFDFILKHRADYAKVVKSWDIRRVIDQKVEKHIERSFNSDNFETIVKKYTELGIPEVERYTKKAEWLYYLKNAEYNKFEKYGKKYIKEYAAKSTFAYHELISSIYYKVNPEEHKNCKKIALKWTEDFIKASKKNINSYSSFVMGYIVGGEIEKAQKTYDDFLKKIKTLSKQEQMYANYTKEYIEGMLKEAKK